LRLQPQITVPAILNRSRNLRVKINHTGISLTTHIKQLCGYVLRRFRWDVVSWFLWCQTKGFKTYDRL